VLLSENGAASEAFDFASPFDHDGNPAQIDRERVRQKWTAAGS
jgi:hypothetical protein